MAGFSNDANGNEIMFADNVDFSGALIPARQIVSDGQLLIGSFSSPNIKSGILVSPDGTISIGYASPNITLQAAFGVSFKWSDIAGAFNPLKNNGYFITGTATGTMPANPAEGDTILFFVDHASQLLTIKASGTQVIRIGTAVSSAGGTMTSNNRGDSIQLVYRTSNTSWNAVPAPQGTWTPA